MKKSLLFSFLLSFFALTLSAQEIATIEGIKYFLDNGEAAIMQQDATFEGNIVIPAEVTSNGVKYAVKSLATSAFSGQKKITSVALPSSITSLGDGCFQECTGLTSITLPKSITSLGEGCFQYRKGLTSNTLPLSITK